MAKQQPIVMMEPSLAWSLWLFMASIALFGRAAMSDYNWEPAATLPAEIGRAHV